MPKPQYESNRIAAMQDLESVFPSSADVQLSILSVHPGSRIPTIGPRHACTQCQPPLNAGPFYSNSANTRLQSHNSEPAPVSSCLSDDQFTFSDTERVSKQFQKYPSASFSSIAMLPGKSGNSQPLQQTNLTYTLPARLEDWSLQAILSALETEPRMHQTLLQPVLPSSPKWLPIDSNRKSPTLKKVYSCDMCQREFNRKNDATRHANVHLKLKPFSCDLCRTKFTRVDTRNAHVKAAKCSPSLK